MKIHHIGYVVKNIEEAKQKFIELGYSIIQDVVFDEYRKIKICFIENSGYVVELVSPEDKNSAIGSLLKKIGNSPYHICYESDDFENDILTFQSSEYFMFDEPHPAVAISNRKVCFLMNPKLGMIELLENL